MIKQYFFGSDVVSDWKVGSSITWSGTFQGKRYQDSGEVLALEPEHLLTVTHWSALSGVPDSPENYHQLSFRLGSQGDATKVTLDQDNNASKEEQEQAAQNWNTVLKGLKELLEHAGSKAVAVAE